MRLWVSYAVVNEKLVTNRNIQYVEPYDFVIDPLKKMLKQ